MSTVPNKVNPRWAVGFVGALITAGLGLALWVLPAGHALVHWSYDLPALLGPREKPEEVIVIKMDEQSYMELKQNYPSWSRALHARLLDKLTADQARLVAFDVYFAQSDPRPEDGVLAQAIKANERVVLAADYSTFAGMKGGTTHPPLDTFRDVAKGWGISLVEFDSDPPIRKCHTSTDEYQSLPWAAAVVAGALVTKDPKARFHERWLRYYGTDGPLPSVSYYAALQQPPGFFKDKIVFIGGKPKTRFTREEINEFHTPFTHRGGPFLSGTEIEATTFLNLLRGDWLTRLPPAMEFALIAFLGALFGFGLAKPSLRMAGTLALAGMFAITLAAWWVFWRVHIWFPWLIVVGTQVPVAFAWSTVVHAIRVAPDHANVVAMPVFASKAASSYSAVKVRRNHTPLTPLSGGTVPFWHPDG